MQATGPAKAQISWWESQQLKKKKKKKPRENQKWIDSTYILNILFLLTDHVNWTGRVLSLDLYSRCEKMTYRAGPINVFVVLFGHREACHGWNAWLTLFRFWFWICWFCFLFSTFYSVLLGFHRWYVSSFAHNKNFLNFLCMTSG